MARVARIARAIDRHRRRAGCRSIYMSPSATAARLGATPPTASREAMAPASSRPRRQESTVDRKCLRAYAEIHIAHSLANTVTLAEMAVVGVCIELFFSAGPRQPAGVLRPRDTTLASWSSYCRLCLRRTARCRAAVPRRQRHSARARRRITAAAAVPTPSIWNCWVPGSTRRAHWRPRGEPTKWSAQ